MMIRPEGLKLYTNSRGRTHRRCAYLHYLTYDIGWRSLADHEARAFGSLMHDALEIWLIEHIADLAVRDEHWRRIWARRGVAVEGDGRAEWAPDPLGCALDAIDAARADAFLKARARAAMRMYHERWAPSMGEYRVIAVELEFVAPLHNPETGAASRTWALAGKIDALVEIVSAGVIAPMEHKTTSHDLTTGGRYWKRLRLDGQLSQYIRGARSLPATAPAWVAEQLLQSAHVIDRAAYDVIKRPDQRPHKATPEAERQYTKPKSKACPMCKKKQITPVPHTIDIGDGKTAECEPGPEGGRIVITDPGGKLYASMRERDETAEEFEQRIYEAIKAEPERYFVRDTITRSDAELRAHEADTWAQAKLMHLGATSGGALAPRNVDACDGDQGACDFLDVCYFGESVLNDELRFCRIDNVHQELHDIAEPPQAGTTTTEEDAAHDDTIS